MPTRLSFSVLLCSALLFLASPAFSAGGSAASGEGVSPRCEAAIDKAAGRYSQCLLKASAKFAKKKNQDDRLFAQQMRCGDKFDNQVARAQDRYGEEQCTPYTSQIADRTATCAEEASIEAGGKAAASRLYVQDAAGGTLTKTTLVLLGVDESTPWFTDRPYREAGQTTTADFVALFAEEGPDSFAENPPNADFTCESGGEVVNQVVTLTDPVLDETAGTLTYTVAIVPNGAGGDFLTEITCDGDAHLFVDDVTIDVAKFASLCQWDVMCKVAGGVWNAETNRCTPGVTQVGCEAGGGTWDAGTSTCTEAPYDVWIGRGCESAGGTWDAGSKTCTAGVTEAGCEAGGGTWNWPTCTPAAAPYNCFVAGFCKEVAKYYPPATYGGGYTNVYEGARYNQGAALAAIIALELPNSRNAETEADRIGIEIAAKAGFDPQAAITLWEKMDKNLGDKKRPPVFLSTHPAPQDRISVLRAIIPTVQPFFENQDPRPIFKLKDDSLTKDEIVF